VALDHAVVVEPHECDDVLDVLVGLDAPRPEAGASLEHGVVVDAPLLEQLSPDRLREPEVRSVVAVQVADLARTDLERELAAPAWACDNSRLRSDYLRDSFHRSLLAHWYLHVPCSLIYTRERTPDEREFHAR
jgi:hypothetical protein